MQEGKKRHPTANQKQTSHQHENKKSNKGEPHRPAAHHVVLVHAAERRLDVLAEREHERDRRVRALAARQLLQVGDRPVGARAAPAASRRRRRRRRASRGAARGAVGAVLGGRGLVHLDEQLELAGVLVEPHLALVLAPHHVVHEHRADGALHRVEERVEAALARRERAARAAVDAAHVGDEARVGGGARAQARLARLELRRGAARVGERRRDRAVAVRVHLRDGVGRRAHVELRQLGVGLRGARVVAERARLLGEALQDLLAVLLADEALGERERGVAGVLGADLYGWVGGGDGGGGARSEDKG